MLLIMDLPCTMMATIITSNKDSKEDPLEVLRALPLDTTSNEDITDVPHHTIHPSLHTLPTRMGTLDTLPMVAVPTVTTTLLTLITTADMAIRTMMSTHMEARRTME